MFTLNHAISPEDSFEIEKAILYLVTNYNESGHNPKPVILHSLRIANMLMEMGYDKKIIIGAVLHDIIEDTNVTDEQLKEDFGQEILDLVIAVSYDESISDPVEQYKDMYDRVLVYGKDAVVLKSVDIAVNSLYIDLVPNPDKRRQLVEKGTYFLDLMEAFSSEPAWQLLKTRNLEEIAKLS
jgi:guanosine-3',5'-bis(diphosphate) 3'-pyrophosphohydrolase